MESRSEGSNSSNSRKETHNDNGMTTVTGNGHILMERDRYSKRYELEQHGKKIEIGDTHFQPIFFAQDVEELRNNVHAQKALKKYRIFVGPDEFVEDLKKDQIPKLNIADTLQEKLRLQQEKDLLDFRQREGPKLERKDALRF